MFNVNKAVREKILSLIVIGMILLLPIQNIYADWTDPFESFIEQGKQAVGSISNLPADSFEKQIPEYIAKFESGELSNETLLFIIKSLDIASTITPETFSYWLIEYPQIQNIIDYYFDNQIKIELEKMPSDWKEVGFDRAIFGITENLDEFGHQNLKLAYATELNIQGLEKPQGFVNESIILGAKSTLIYDFESHTVMTLDQYAKKTIENEPNLRNTDFAKDPVRAGLLLIIDGEYLYVAPLIPVGNEQYISLAQFCQLEIDIEKCEQAKTFLKVASNASKAKDPSLFVYSIKSFLGIIQDFNHDYELGLDNEIEHADYILSVTPNDLANAKILEKDGRFISINEASEIQFHNEKINLVHIVLNELNNPKLNDQQRIENIILVLKIINEINALS